MARALSLHLRFGAVGFRVWALGVGGLGCRAFFKILFPLPVCKVQGDVFGLWGLGFGHLGPEVMIHLHSQLGQWIQGLGSRV